MNERRACGGRRLARLLVGIGSVALALAPTSVAFAHESEQNVPAMTSVQQAIAIIRSQPELTDLIDDKIGDALGSEDTDGVDIAKMKEAQAAFEDGDLWQTELLLEQAIGACPGQPVVNPEGIRTPAPITSPCPAPAHLTALGRIPVGGTARPVLLGLAGLAIVGGLFMVRRTHGHAR